MKRISLLACLSLCPSVLAAGTGCEVTDCTTEEGESAVCSESLQRYTLDDGEIEPDALPYSPGMHVSVDGVYGAIQVEEGTTGEVSVLIEPFTYRGHSKDDEAREELESFFAWSFIENGNVVQVTTGRLDGSTNGLGAEITLFLPSDFDGELAVRNRSNGPINPGDIDVNFVGEATLLEIQAESLGDCFVDGAPSVTFTQIFCDGEITLRDGSDNVRIASTGLGGGAQVRLSQVGSGAQGGFIETEDGDIEFVLPSGPFSIQAEATEDGTVSEENVPGACELVESSSSQKDVDCGQGVPSYDLAAGIDGVGPSNIVFTYL
jgi:hypothetical protein